MHRIRAAMVASVAAASLALTTPLASAAAIDAPAARAVVSVHQAYAGVGDGQVSVRVDHQSITYDLAMPARFSLVTAAGEVFVIAPGTKFALPRQITLPSGDTVDGKWVQVDAAHAQFRGILKQVDHVVGYQKNQTVTPDGWNAQCVLRGVRDGTIPVFIGSWLLGPEVVGPATMAAFFGCLVYWTLIGCWN